MSRRDEKGRPGKPGLLLSFVLALAAPVRLSGSEPARLQLQAADNRSGLETTLGRAIQSASQKLSTSACQQVFSDFRDSAGQTLQQNLDAGGHTGEAHLALMLFYNGNGMTRCQERSVLASTSPGSRVIYVCAAQFVERLRRDPGLGAPLIIHEQLHSLGLAENPPDSREITAQVIARCGR